MKDGATTNEGAVADLNVTGEQGGIGDDVVGSQSDVVTEVAANHEKIVGSQTGAAVWFAASMNRDVFTNDGAGSDFDTADSIGVKAKVLWSRTDDCGTADDAFGGKGDVPDDLGMSFNAAAFLNDGWSVDDDIGTNIDRRVDLSFWVNDGGRVDHVRDVR